MSIAATDVTAILKEDYGPDGVANLAYKENPAFATVNKKNFTGRYYYYPAKYGYASNRSRTGATALNKTNGVQFIDFQVPTVADYDAKSIAKKALVEAEDPNTFIELLRSVSDDVLKALSNNAGSDFFNNRGAAIGTINTNSTVASATINLADPDDVTRFYVGQTIAASSANGLSGSLRTGTAVISAIDRGIGALTTAGGNWSTQITSLSASSNTTFGDYLFPAGDFGLGRAGLADWVPDVTTGLGTAFYNVTRSTDATRMAGSRTTITGLPISQGIRLGLAQLGREEGSPDTLYMAWDILDQLVTERDVKSQHILTDSVGMGATIGFKTIEIIGPRGPLNCIADRSVNSGRIYAVKDETMVCIHSQGEPVMLEDEDGSIIIRESGDFTFDLRGQSFLNFACHEPVHLGVFLF